MTVRRQVLSRSFADARGSTMVEFALAAPVLATALVGVLELGMVLLVSILLESALRDASRYGITGLEVGGQSRLENIAAIVASRTVGLVDLDTADFDVRVYSGFDDVGRGEAFIDGNGNGTYDNGETFTDENDNGVWDDDVGSPGPGGASDVVVYRIAYDWPLLTPLAAGFIGHGGAVRLTASVAVRNEPWDTGGVGAGE